MSSHKVNSVSQFSSSLTPDATLTNQVSHQGDTTYFARNTEPPPAYSYPSPSPTNTDIEAGTIHVVPIPVDDKKSIKTLYFTSMDGRSLTLSDLPVTMKISDVSNKLVKEKNLPGGVKLRFLWGGVTLNERAFSLSLFFFLFIPLRPMSSSSIQDSLVLVLVFGFGFVQFSY